MPFQDNDSVVVSESGHILDLVDIHRRMLRGWQRAIRLAKVEPRLREHKRQRARHLRRAMGEIAKEERKAQAAAGSRDIDAELAHFAFDSSAFAVAFAPP